MEVRKKHTSKGKSDEGAVRLNKYLAHLGLGTRRETEANIKAGDVTVNGEKVINPGLRVSKQDLITFKGNKVEPPQQLHYLLLNKPKNVDTDSDHNKGRNSVMGYVPKTLEERLNPVGKLEKDASGLLLLTNDAELLKKMSDPTYRLSKVYEVMLDKPISEGELKKIRSGIKIEVGPIHVDAINFVHGKSNKEVALEISSEEEDNIESLFDHLGFKIEQMDRTRWAGLTKKDLPRGRFRPLTDREIIMLKHFS